MSHSASANKPPLVSRAKLFEAVAKGLRNEIGRGKRHSVKEAANGSGVPDRMIECAKYEPDHEEWRPLSIEQLMSLSSFLGPDFTTSWLQLADQGAFWLPDQQETPPGEIAADNSDDNAVVTRAAMDGKFDRDERRALGPVGVRMMSRGAELIRIGAAA